MVSWAQTEATLTEAATAMLSSLMSFMHRRFAEKRRYGRRIPAGATLSPSPQREMVTKVPISTSRKRRSAELYGSRMQPCEAG